MRIVPTAWNCRRCSSRVAFRAPVQASRSQVPGFKAGKVDRRVVKNLPFSRSQPQMRGYPWGCTNQVEDVEVIIDRKEIFRISSFGTRFCM